VLSHFDQVMRERFLPSGRVRWLPMNEYRAGPGGAHEVTSLINGNVAQIVPRKKLVDATHAQTAVPSTHPPKYAVAARREMHTSQSASRDSMGACGLHGGRLGKDWHG
jgi:hypothetical protein